MKKRKLLRKMYFFTQKVGLLFRININKHKK
jgi:hypothetical protein